MFYPLAINKVRHAGEVIAVVLAETKKQAEAFRLVFDSGYYSIPRQSHLSELGEKLGIKRVALQERLRRAELQIMSAYAKDLF